MFIYRFGSDGLALIMNNACYCSALKLFRELFSIEEKKEWLSRNSSRHESISHYWHRKIVSKVLQRFAFFWKIFFLLLFFPPPCVSLKKNESKTIPSEILTKAIGIVKFLIIFIWWWMSSVEIIVYTFGRSAHSSDIYLWNDTRINDLLMRGRRFLMGIAQKNRATFIKMHREKSETQ